MSMMSKKDREMLLRRRADLGMTQKQVAEEMGMSVSTVGKIERYLRTGDDLEADVLLRSFLVYIQLVLGLDLPEFRLLGPLEQLGRAHDEEDPPFFSHESWPSTKE